MNRLIPLYATVMTFVQNRVERAKNAEDRGASLIEYGALLALIAAIIAALAALGIPGKVGSYIGDALNSIFGTNFGGN